MSENAPLAVELQLPSDPSEVVPYLHDLFYGAAPVLLDGLIEQARAEISRCFPDLDVIGTLRRALS